MVAYDPNNRPSIQEIKNHPWFLEPKATEYETKMILESRIP